MEIEPFKKFNEYTEEELAKLPPTPRDNKFGEDAPFMWMGSSWSYIYED